MGKSAGQPQEHPTAFKDQPVKREIVTISQEIGGMRWQRRPAMPSIHDKIAQLIRDQDFKPFDTELKAVIRRPGVLKLLWNDFRNSEIVRLKEAVREFPPAITDGTTEWLAEEYKNEQIVFRSDLLASVEGSFIHVEQQTKHNRVVMLRRMAEYANTICASLNYEVQLYQMYYYTGSTRVQWDRKLRKRANIENANWSLVSRFLFVDAGDHDAHAMLSTGNLDYAMLGLLARTIEDEQGFIEGLIDVIYRRYRHNRLELIPKLVTCIIVGSLRDRGMHVWERIPVGDHREVQNVEERVVQTWMAISERQGRDFAAEIAETLTALQAGLGFSFPLEFNLWAMRHISEVQLRALSENVSNFDNVAELLEAAQIQWPPHPVGGRSQTPTFTPKN
ncbi:hypothetical protein HB780_18700 [Rhizobium lusitanum]|uniref:hypothetical protein n=1 Tax=Rhizobium lusitanum TaxID=293958 RepID=UPI0016167A48|nr:hypothetical protein [Rhizobium lusitanum]QND47703.1 hypothetical protein HB780_18700 [Rhizobium lusitanum]